MTVAIDEAQFRLAFNHVQKETACILPTVSFDLLTRFARNNSGADTKIKPANTRELSVLFELVLFPEAQNRPSNKLHDIVCS